MRLKLQDSVERAALYLLAAAFILVVGLITLDDIATSDSPADVRRDLVLGVAAGLVSGVVLLFAGLLVDLASNLEERSRTADTLWLALVWRPAGHPRKDPEFLAALETFLISHGHMRCGKAHDAVDGYVRTGELQPDAYRALEAFLTPKLYRRARAAKRRGGWWRG